MYGILSRISVLSVAAAVGGTVLAATVHGTAPMAAPGMDSRTAPMVSAQDATAPLECVFVNGVWYCFE